MFKKNVEISYMGSEIRQVYISGHRNPDIDSLASSYALAELRRRQGMINAKAICPGILSERGQWLFERFHFSPPESKNDVYLRIGDIMSVDVPVIHTGVSLLDAVKFLNSTGFARLPIVDGENTFLGMLSPINLLSHLLDIGQDSDSGFTGKQIFSSIELIAKVTDAEILSGTDMQEKQIFLAYVAAMGEESFDTHVPIGEEKHLCVITGDRSEIHLRAISRNVRLLIVTSERPIEPLLLSEAKRRGVSVLKTSLDPAAVTRRLKFSVPVEDFGHVMPNFILHPDERVPVYAARIVNSTEDVIPVIDDNSKFTGVVLKKDISDTPPYRMILVDHNETEQSIPGVEEIPVIEVVDHHRIGMRPTITPIKFTGDVVGSTCTLVAMMYRSSGESLTPELAGLLLAGITQDTLNLQSPTTSVADIRITEWLSKIAGIRSDELMNEISRIDSPLTSKSPEEVINSDRKTYTNGSFKFALSQVEETNLELLHNRQNELVAAMQGVLNSELLAFIGIMVTDAVRGNSELLIIGNSDVLRMLPYQKISDRLYALPGVLSRKKQLLPNILSITTEIDRR